MALIVFVVSAAIHTRFWVELMHNVGKPCFIGVAFVLWLIILVADKYFSALPARPLPPLVNTVEPLQDGPKRVDVA